jgi:hypothetical protein
MDYHTNLRLPAGWRASLQGEEKVPQEPIYVNWDTAPDCVVGTVRVKILSPVKRVLHFALLDDGWESDEVVCESPGTVTLELGADRYSITAQWEDEPALASPALDHGDMLEGRRPGWRIEGSQFSPVSRVGTSPAPPRDFAGEWK